MSYVYTSASSATNVNRIFRFIFAAITSILPPEFAIFGGIFLFYKDFTENESLVDEVSYRVEDLHKKEL